MSELDKLREILEREKLTRQICAELNNFVDLKDMLTSILASVRKLTGCEAVGLRLHDNGDYPYFVSDGFPGEFIEKEHSLCARDKDNLPLPDPQGKGYLLECMCGNIIRGRFDPSLPFFTPNGSFCSNHTSALLASTSDEERQSHTRNYCNSCGYETVALIPIRARSENLGLLQVNDKRKDMLDEGMLHTLEMIANNIGLAVQNALSHTRLKKAMDEIKVLRGIIPICSNCKQIRDDKGFWHQVEEYVRDHTQADFSHSICPACVKKLYPELAVAQTQKQSTTNNCPCHS